MAPTDVVQNLIGDETKFKALPSSWSRNAKRAMLDKKRSRQQDRGGERELRGERRFVDTRESRNASRLA